jgi:hypothetical protein
MQAGYVEDSYYVLMQEKDNGSKYKVLGWADKARILEYKQQDVPLRRGPNTRRHWGVHHSDLRPIEELASTIQVMATL